MTYFIDFFFSLLHNSALLLFVNIISGCAKAYLLTTLTSKAIRSEKLPKPFFLLIGILMTAIIIDFTWVMTLLREDVFPVIDYRVVIFLLRISWACDIALSLFLGLFIESLSEKSYRMRWYQKIFTLIALVFSGYFVALAFLSFNNLTERSFEYTMMTISSMYVLQLFILPSLAVTIKKIHLNGFPKILKKQLTLLITHLIIPYIVVESIQAYFISSKEYVYAVNIISTPLLTFAMYYCMRTVMGLRFLNFQSHVQSPHTFNFMTDFKNVLEQLSHVSTNRELRHISQMFFKEAFAIIPNRTNLYFRKLDATERAQIVIDDFTSREAIVENFIARHSNDRWQVAEQIHRSKILIYDEFVFSNFHEDNQFNQEIQSFLDQINADIFLPIYEGQLLIAYLIIDRDARVNKFYSDVERDEMLVFASYVGNVINLLQNRNLDSLLAREKEMREELYRKHQEVNQYKESIRSFVRDNKQRKIGILFYKNRRFIFGNQAAKELVDINLNVQDGHPITKALKKIAHQVEEYKTAQTTFFKDQQGNQLVFAALPNLDQNNVIITVSYPEIADVIKQQIELLKNPSEWDYLLYLETTRPGTLIHQLVPGSGQHLLNFKIDLLKIALSKKALLLEMPTEDLLPTVEIIHHISLRETLHILTLQPGAADVAVKLFGINPIFGKQAEQPLLEKLDNVGTLFIQNIEHLDLQTQHNLAEFIQYGYYHVYKSDQRVASSVRIICSTAKNLTTLMQEGKFSRALFNELKQTTLVMPSFAQLTEQEMSDLVDGFTEQALSTPVFKNLLELSDKDKHKLIGARPVSLHEFKMKVQQVLVHKSKKNQIYHETQFDPAYNVTDPELTQAARLGKKALRDQKMMTMLWNKFKNQNKIASFLGVNRSSINRRCKEYNLN